MTELSFSFQISNFTNYGTYDYKFDDVGNEILNPSSSTFQQVYFALPLSNFAYNEDKILSFYNPEFTEFIPTTPTTASVFPQDVTNLIASMALQNQQLQDQLNNLIVSSQVNSGSAYLQAVKNIILGLRIQLGQGSSLNDFQNTFPYAPIPLEMINPPTSSM